MPRLSLVLFVLMACGEPSSQTEDLPPLEAEVQQARVPVVGLTLEGVLHLPARPADARVPAVVLMHGSGPNDRHETSGGQLNVGFGFEVQPFRDIARGLADQGIAVLRYDKRTCGPFNGTCDNSYPTPSAEVRVTEFIADAIAAGAWLADQPSIDPARIVFVGHSQGAAAMPAALSEGAVFAGGVSLGGNWRPIDDLIRFQRDSSRQLLLDLGASEASADATLSDLTRQVDDLAELRAGTFLATTIGGAPLAFWEDWLAIGDARPALTASLVADARPMLAIGGSHDTNVPNQPELDLWAAAGVPTLALEGVMHPMNRVLGDPPPAISDVQPSDLGTATDARVIDAVGAFVLSL